jgi:carbon monoxide dehydrogenase subunit G
MELAHSFTVSVPFDRAWDVLTDLERVAPCMPGAELQEVEGEEYRGVVKVKVGPITSQYKGVARFLELDREHGRIVLNAEGRDTRSQGNASAKVIATLEADGESTSVRIITDLSITGKVAQFGRGMLEDVSSKLIEQFVQRLEADVLSAPSASPADTNQTDSAPTDSIPTDAAGNKPGRPAAAPVEPVDLFATAGSSIVRRVGPVVLAVVLIGAAAARMLRRVSRTRMGAKLTKE